MTYLHLHIYIFYYAFLTSQKCKLRRLNFLKPATKCVKSTWTASCICTEQCVTNSLEGGGEQRLLPVSTFYASTHLIGCCWQLQTRRKAGELSVFKCNSLGKKAIRMESPGAAVPLRPCRSTHCWSSCRAFRLWPSRGRRWTWRSSLSSSGYRCRSPCSTA